MTAALRHGPWLLLDREVSPSAAVLDAVDEAIGRGTRIVLAFGGEEPLQVELERDGALEALRRRAGVQLVELPGADHTVRPLEAQRRVRELVRSAVLRAARDVDPGRAYSTTERVGATNSPER
jgi:hypothetical protein